MPDIRIGFGIDIHEFSNSHSDNKDLFLCGVKIPYFRGMKGHSDADVVLHALCDAIYGSLGLGDIGEHFPPSEQKWKGESSVTFLEHAYDKLNEKNGKINNIDITILAEEPIIKNYKHKMKAFLASQLEINEDRINIKATTTEKLGFIGRKEGILATAGVCIYL